MSHQSVHSSVAIVLEELNYKRQVQVDSFLMDDGLPVCSLIDLEADSARLGRLQVAVEVQRRLSTRFPKDWAHRSKAS
jgi:hypothetical protein